MKYYNLSASDYQNIKSLIGITKSITELYNKLYDLEISGRKNSDEYKKNISYLQIAIEIEEKKLTLMVSDSKKVVDILNYLVNEFPSVKEMSDIEQIILQKSDFNYIRRITGILSNIAMKYQVLNAMKNIPKELELNIPSEILNAEINKSFNMEAIMESECIQSLLCFVNDAITDANNNIFKNELIGLKYSLSFINRIIEKLGLIGNLGFINSLSFDSDYCAKYQKMPNIILRITKNSFGSNIIDEQTKQLLFLHDIDYNDKSIALSALVRQLYMRSAFLFMSDDEIDNANFEFHELIKSADYLKKYDNDNISKNLIINAYQKVRKDRVKEKIISF